MRREKVRKVQTIPLRDQILEDANKRNDSWGCEVIYRLQNCYDLVAEEAVYHSTCLSKFRKVPKCLIKAGRPLTYDKNTAFEDVCTMHID